MEIRPGQRWVRNTPPTDDGAFAPAVYGGLYDVRITAVEAKWVVWDSLRNPAMRGWTSDRVGFLTMYHLEDDAATHRESGSPPNDEPNE